MIGNLDLKYDKEAYLLAKKLNSDKKEQFIMSYTENKKSFTIGLILWFLLGGIRFIFSYLLIILPFILWIIDGCNLSKNIIKYNSEVAHKHYNLEG